MASTKEEPCSRARCFSTLLTSLGNGLSQFQSETPPLKGQATADFDHEKFRSLMGKASAALAHDANKLAIAFKAEPLPSPEETRAMCAQAEQKTVLLLSLYLSLSPNCGRHLLTTVGGMCSEAVAALVELVKFLESSESATELNQEAMLLIVGSVWEKCDVISKKLPATNRECCSEVIFAQRTLVSDATKELEEALKLAGEEVSGEKQAKDDDDEDSFCPGETWSPAERLLVPPGAGLLKTAAALLKKVAESVTKSKGPNQTSHPAINT